VDLAALRRAARAAIVMPAVFALADKVIGKPQTSLFAAFGSFALLVLTEFGGPRRARLLAYMGLAGVGATLITLGTLCSRDPWLGAGAMALIGFGTLFAGAFSGYFAAGATGALLTFVLSVTIPAPSSAIPDRLEGWGLATGAGICAAMLLWPRRRPADLRREAAGALRAVAELLEAHREQLAERACVAREAVDALGRRLLGSQHRPTGPTGPTVALASLPDELDWLLSFLAPSAELSALELAGRKMLKRSRRPRPFSARAPKGSKVVTASPTSHGWKQRETPLRRRSYDVSPSCRSRLPPERCRKRSTRPPESGRQPTPRGRSAAMRCSRREPPRPSSIPSTSLSRRRRVAHSKRRSRSRSSTSASARCGCRTASGEPPGWRSPSTSLSERACSTASGSCSGRSPCCVPMRSARAGRFSAHSEVPLSESSSARCS